MDIDYAMFIVKGLMHEVYLKVTITGSGFPTTLKCNSSEKTPSLSEEKWTSSVWQAPGGITPSEGLKEKQRPNTVLGFTSLYAPFISPLLVRSS